MLLANAVTAASCLIAVFNMASGVPRPAITRERHIIHAPIKFKIIHHYKVKKIPVLIKKHLYYYYNNNNNNNGQVPKTASLEENHSDRFRQEDADRDHLDFYGYRGHWNPESGDREAGGETPPDYEEPQQSEEDEYEEDYEYE